MQQLLQQEKITSSLAAKEKENHLLMPIQSQSESCSYQHSAKKIPHFFGFILCLCLLLHGPVSWFSSSESQNRVWEKIEIAAKPPQNLALQSTELQQTKINLPYDLASGSSVYCNGDPVNGWIRMVGVWSQEMLELKQDGTMETAIRSVTILPVQAIQPLIA